MSIQSLGCCQTPWFPPVANTCAMMPPAPVGPPGGFFAYRCMLERMWQTWSGMMQPGCQHGASSWPTGQYPEFAGPQHHHHDHNGCASPHVDIHRHEHADGRWDHLEENHRRALREMSRHADEVFDAKERLRDRTRHTDDIFNSQERLREQFQQHFEQFTPEPPRVPQETPPPRATPPEQATLPAPTTSPAEQQPPATQPQQTAQSTTTPQPNKMTYGDAVGTLHNQFDLLDTAAGQGERDNKVSRADLEAAANNPELDPKLREACQMMLNNPALANKVDTAQGGDVDGMYSREDLATAVNQLSGQQPGEIPQQWTPGGAASTLLRYEGLVDTASGQGKPDGKLSQADLQAVLASPDAPPDLLAAARYLLENPAAYNRLDTGASDGDVDGMVSRKDLERVVLAG